MDILDVIRHRHSVRSYLDKQIEQEKVDELQREVELANKESGLNIQLVTNEPEAFSSSIFTYGKFKNVTNYIALVGKKTDENLDEKVGYFGEGLVIKAGELGLNTCWVALTFNKKKAKVKVESGEKLVCVIAFGYGETIGVPHKSKPMEKLCNLKADDPMWFKRGIEMAILAPTAVNQQQFYIERKENKVHFEKKVGFYSNVDMGIVKYHFEVGAGKENFEWI